MLHKAIEVINQGKMELEDEDDTFDDIEKDHSKEKRKRKR